MKRIYLILCLLICHLFGTGQGIVFFHGSYEEALKKAQKEDKQIFVDVYTSWCGPCKMMAKNVFSDESVGKYYNQHFVCLKLDAEKEKKHGFFKNYQAGGYPSLFWMSAAGKLIDMHVGYMEAQAFIEKGKQLKNSNQAEVWETYRQRWDAGERSEELIDKYVFGYLERAEPNKTKDCCIDYLKSLGEEQLKSKHTYRIVQAFGRELEDGIILDCQLKYWNDYKKYDDYMTFNIKRYRLLVRNANVAAGVSEKALQRHIQILKKKEFPQKDMYMEIIDAETTLVKDLEKGIPKLFAVAQKYGREEPWLFSQFAYSLVNAGYFISPNSSPEETKQVRYITERAYELFPSQETAVYVAVTYLKEGNLREAYATLGVLPFLKAPMLSSALYKKVGLKRHPLTEYSRETECREMQAKVRDLLKQKR